MDNERDIYLLADIFPLPKRPVFRPRAKFELMVTYTHGSMTGEGTKRDLLREAEWHTNGKDVLRVWVLRDDKVIWSWEKPKQCASN